jgi:quinol monooxygenase YgiN
MFARLHVMQTSLHLKHTPRVSSTGPKLNTPVADSSVQSMLAEDRFAPKSEPVWMSEGRMVIKPGHVDEFRAAVSKISAPTRQEPGCIAYDAFVVLDDQGQETNQYEFHEVWKSRDAMFVDHLEKSPHMQTFFQEIHFGSDDSFVESFVPLSSGYVKSLS